MKKIIFLVTMLLSIALFSGYKKSGPNETAEKNVKPTYAKDLKSINKPEAGASKADIESLSPIIANDSKPRILLMLTNDTGMTKWSPSLWWSYHHVKPGQPGC